MKIKNSWLMFLVFASLVVAILDSLKITIILMHIVLLLRLLQEEINDTK